MRKFLSLSLLGALALVPAAFAQDVAGHVVTLTASSNSETSLAISPSTADAGTPIVMKADVQPTQGGPSATGTVGFYFGGYLLGTAPVQGTVAQLTLNSSNVPPGKFGITARYSGDKYYQPSTSGVVYVSVVSVTNSEVSLATSPSSIEPGNYLTLKADVQPKQGGASPTGTVLFFGGDNGIYYLGSAPVYGTVAQLSLKVTGVPAGTYPIVAVYLGNSTYLASISNASYVTVQ
jgi:hypothetical protein